MLVHSSSKCQQLFVKSMLHDSSPRLSLWTTLSLIRTRYFGVIFQILLAFCLNTCNLVITCLDLATIFSTVWTRQREILQ